MPNPTETATPDSTARPEPPSLLLSAGIVALPVVFALTAYLDQGAWLFAANRAVLVTTLLSLAFIGVPTLLLRDRVHGALVGLCGLLMILLHPFPAVVLALAVIAALIILDGLRASTARERWSKVMRVLHNVLGVFGIALLAVTIVQFGLRGQITGFSADGSAAPADASAPDIWLVLLDGYPRADALQRDWGFDNLAFLGGLERLGFTVADKSRSNYNTTKLTLPALFNMALLQDLEPWSAHDKPADAPAAERVQALQHNRAFELLRDHGYRITSIGAGYTHEEVRAVDEFIDSGDADLVEVYLMGVTALGDLLQAFDPGFGERQVSQRIEANLDTLVELSQVPSERPHFVFGHIPGPHPPLALATVERPFAPLIELYEYPVDLVGEELLHETYRSHISELNDRALEALTAIVEAAGDESVVIVISDHGSRTQGFEHSLTSEEVDEQFSTLFAARTPDGEVLFEDDVVVTDALSTVFNRYLGTEIPPVDRVFESMDGTRYEE